MFWYTIQEKENAGGILDLKKKWGCNVVSKSRECVCSEWLDDGMDGSGFEAQ